MDAQTRYEKRAYFSGKRFVPLIFHLFSIEGGARHPWQLSAIATAIATWLGALSRSHGTRAHHKGGANSGEVQKTAQGERKGCTRTWKTNAPRAHRVVHRAHRAYVSHLHKTKGPTRNPISPTPPPSAGVHVTPPPAEQFSGRQVLHMHRALMAKPELNWVAVDQATKSDVFLVDTLSRTRTQLGSATA